MAYEALNNLGHSGARVLIVLNDNGRSYAPTVSRLSGSLTQLRLDPRYMQLRERVRHLRRELPAGVGSLALHLDPRAHRRRCARSSNRTCSSRRSGSATRARSTATTSAASSRRSAGPRAGTARSCCTWSRPRARATRPAEADDIACLHDMKAHGAARRRTGRPGGTREDPVRSPCPGGRLDRRPAALPGPLDAGESYTEAFSRALVEVAAKDERIVAITAAMPGPTGLLAFQDRYPDRFVDVGIAEQHALTAAAGMAMSGLRPVVAIYSTFLARAVDQWNLDVGPPRPARRDLRRPGGSHRRRRAEPPRPLRPGPGAADTRLRHLLSRRAGRDRSDARRGAQAHGPSLLRYPEDALSRARSGGPGPVSRRAGLRHGTGDVVLVGIGKMTRAMLAAAAELVQRRHRGRRLRRPRRPPRRPGADRGDRAQRGSSSRPRTASRTGAPAPTWSDEADRVAGRTGLPGPRRRRARRPDGLSAARQAGCDPLPPRPRRPRHRRRHAESPRPAPACGAGPAGGTAGMTPRRRRSRD